MNPLDLAEAAADPELTRYDSAVGWAGVLGSVRTMRTDGWAPRGFDVAMATTGDLLTLRGGRHRGSSVSYGTGRAWRDPARARFIAVCEGLERYSSLAYRDEDFLVASARDLGPEALDLELIPRYSDREIARPGSGVTLPPMLTSIRWTEGVDLLTSQPVRVPAILAYLLTERRENERFCVPISTGCAVHRTMAAALVGGICEVIERDGASLAWLQCLPLPLVDEAVLDDDVRELRDWCSHHGIRTYFFDATTDVGVPTVLCLQLNDGSTRCAQLAATAGDLDARAAVRKSLLECMGFRGTMHARPPAPRSYADFTTITDSALLMGRPSRRPAFDFLLRGCEERATTPSSTTTPTTTTTTTAPTTTTAMSDVEQLRFLLARLESLGLHVYAVDITARELREAGLFAVRVIIPELLPMSLQPRAQYRATPRLYEAPVAMGYEARPESRLNRHPLPLT